jgi:hypothetical protein
MTTPDFVAGKTSVFSGKLKYYRTLCQRARPPFGQKIVPIFCPGLAPTLGRENFSFLWEIKNTKLKTPNQN